MILKLLGHQTMFGRHQTLHITTNTSVKLGGGSFMLGCFSAAGPRRLVKVEGKIHAAKYRDILEAKPD